MTAKGNKTEKTVKPAVYTKEQLVKSKKYMPYADFLDGNLQDDKTYTAEQVETLISKSYRKGKSE